LPLVARWNGGGTLPGASLLAGCPDFDTFDVPYYRDRSARPMILNNFHGIVGAENMASLLLYSET